MFIGVFWPHGRGMEIHPVFGPPLPAFTIRAFEKDADRSAWLAEDISFEFGSKAIRERAEDLSEPMDRTALKWRLDILEGR